jgi:hypothetical protein
MTGKIFPDFVKTRVLSERRHLIPPGPTPHYSDIKAISRFLQTTIKEGVIELLLEDGEPRILAAWHEPEKIRGKIKM